MSRVVHYTPTLEPVCGQSGTIEGVGAEWWLVSCHKCSRSPAYLAVRDRDDGVMTVRELIEVLSHVRPDLPVWHDGGGDGYMACGISSVDISLNHRSRYLGNDEWDTDPYLTAWLG